MRVLPGLHRLRVPRHPTRSPVIRNYFPPPPLGWIVRASAFTIDTYLARAYIPPRLLLALVSLTFNRPGMNNGGIGNDVHYAREAERTKRCADIYELTEVSQLAWTEPLHSHNNLIQRLVLEDVWILRDR